MDKIYAVAEILGHDEFTIFGDEVVLDSGELTAAQKTAIADLTTNPRASKADVDLHAKFLIKQGGTFKVGKPGEYKWIALSGAPEEASVLQGYAFAAQLRLMQKSIRNVMFVDHNEVVHSVSEDELLELWSKGSAYISKVLETAYALKRSPVISGDFRDTAPWPTI